MDNINNLKIIQEYKNMASKILKMSFSNLSDNDLNEALDYSIIKRMKNSKAILDNNYKKKKINTTILDLCEYILSREPIITASGVMFKKHAECPNPLANMIKGFMDGRNINKSNMFKYPKGSEDYEKYNLLQLLDKLDANALYGAIGNFSCIYYNLYIAPSVTTQGRSCISAAGLQFEMFLSDNVKFASLDEIITFIYNICEEANERKYIDDVILDRDITIYEAFFKVMKNCGFGGYIPSQEDMLIVWELMCHLKQEDLNRIYYKNNLYEFINNANITTMIIHMLESLDKPYLDPNKEAPEIKDDLINFCSIMMEYVYYHHQIIDKMDKYPEMIRNVCIVTDTDSCLISLEAWYRCVLEKVIDIPMKIKHGSYKIIDFIKADEFGDKELMKPIEFIDTPLDYSFYDDEIIELQKCINPLEIIPQDGLRYSIVNLLAYCIGNIINDYMERFTMNSNSWSEDKKCLMIMKNELLFKKVLVIPNAKKHYASIQEIQEGHIIEGGMLDIKGLEMTKSTANKRTQEALKEIMLEDVLNCDEIEISNILKKIAILEKEIFNSLQNGEKEFFKPIRFKSMNSYENPMSTSGIKQSIVWNTIRRETEPLIDLESRNEVDLVKLKINSKNISTIKDIYPDIYDKLIELMKQDVFKNGIEGIAIPRDAEVPKWLTHFIDYTSIINDNLGLFPIEPLGLYKGNKSNNYTNILSL